MHDQNPVAHGEKPFVVGDHDGGLAQFVGLISKQVGHVLSMSGVQGGGSSARMMSGS